MYEVLGLSRDCSPDKIRTIRSAYRRLAPQRHPEKLIKSLLSDVEATTQFQEVVCAYEVLSDQILFSSSKRQLFQFCPALFSYFSTSSYSGYLDSSKVATSYNCRAAGFVTLCDFCWFDQYDLMMGPNRKSRRVMEEEIKKLWKKALRESNDIVSGLSEFKKKRDKRVIDMQLKRNEEMEKENEDGRKMKELARLKAAKA